MVKNISIIGILFLFVTLSGCVKDGVEECPAGTVQLHFFVEKFRNKSLNPLDDREAKFCDRVGHIRYYLYKDGTLIRNQIVDQFQDVGSNCYSLSLPDLEYGDYEMVLVANCTKRALSGDPVKSSNLLLTYPGSSDTEDFFTAVFPFTVNSNEAKEYEVGLLRTHGVVRYTFLNMPSDVYDFEVVMENVGNEKWISGD